MATTLLRVSSGQRAVTTSQLEAPGSYLSRSRGKPSSLKCRSFLSSFQTSTCLSRMLSGPEETAVNKTDDPSLCGVHVPAEEQVLASQTNRYVIGCLCGGGKASLER